MRRSLLRICRLPSARTINAPNYKLSMGNIIHSGLYSAHAAIDRQTSKNQMCERTPRPDRGPAARRPPWPRGASCVRNAPPFWHSRRIPFVFLRQRCQDTARAGEDALVSARDGENQSAMPASRVLSRPSNTLPRARNLFNALPVEPPRPLPPPRPPRP